MSGVTTRERLIDAAFALFDERGFDATTVDHIAERAGVGRTTFFRHFPTKEDVIFPDHDALIAAVGDRLRASTDGNGLLAVTEAARLVLRHYLEEGERARTRYRLTSTRAWCATSTSSASSPNAGWGRTTARRCSPS